MFTLLAEFVQDIRAQPSCDVTVGHDRSLPSCAIRWFLHAAEEDLARVAGEGIA